MSAHRAFGWTYTGELTAAKIADFLILNPQFPRSLRASVQDANYHLDCLTRGYGRATRAQSHARTMLAELVESQVSDIFDEGLHEFLLRFMARNAGLAGVIQDTYLQGNPE